MQRIERLSSNLKLQRSGGGLFHDTRKDVVTLASVINKLHDKINELVEDVNRLNGIINDKNK